MIEESVAIVSSVFSETTKVCSDAAVQCAIEGTATNVAAAVAMLPPAKNNSTDGAYVVFEGIAMLLSALFS